MARILLCKTSLFALVVFLIASSAFAQQKEAPLCLSQEEIAERLASPDRRVSSSVLSDYDAIPAKEQTQDLRDAATQALRYENERRREFYLSGEKPSPEKYNYMYGFRLASKVKQLRDPAYADALLPWLCCGNSPVWIDMGREAIRPVLEFVYANEPGYEEAIRGGIYVLQMMVDHWGLDAFDASEQEQLRQIAHRHIANEDDLGEWANLMPSIDLASAIEDAELIRMAQAIADDEDEMRKRRITSEYRLRDFQHTVSAVVSGARKPYRHLTPEENAKREEELYRKAMENPEEFDPFE